MKDGVIIEADKGTFTWHWAKSLFNVGIRIIRNMLFGVLIYVLAWNITIFVTPEGECVRIETDDNAYPCTDEIKRDTSCWDENGETELCGAKWEQVKS